MLGKLLKYEYKATARTFLPLYGGLLLITFLCSGMTAAYCPVLPAWFSLLTL